MANRWGNNRNSERLFWRAPNSLQMVTAAMKLKDASSLDEKLDQPRQHIAKQRHYFANKGSSSQGYGFSCGHVSLCEIETGGAGVGRAGWKRGTPKPLR